MSEWKDYDGIEWPDTDDTCPCAWHPEHGFAYAYYLNALEAERNALRAALDLAEWTSHGAMLADDGAHCGVCQRNQTEGHATGCAVAAALDNKKPPA